MMHSEYGTSVIIASRFNQLSKYTKVFNIQDVGNIISVKLPSDFPRDVELTNVVEFATNSSIDFEEHVTRMERQPWIDIQANSLNMTNGQHIYGLVFQDPITGMPLTCWFSYIIQDADAVKPYIYMKREKPDTQESVESDISEEPEDENLSES